MKTAANLVLQDTIERIFALNKYADIQRGVFLVRGENVLMLGEIVRPSRLDEKKAAGILGLTEHRIWIRRRTYRSHSKRRRPKRFTDYLSRKERERRPVRRDGRQNLLL